MKALKPFAATFFSEYFLSNGFDDEKNSKSANEEVKVGELISLDDKGKGKETDEAWTTEWGTEAGFHTGL